MTLTWSVLSICGFVLGMSIGYVVGYADGRRRAIQWYEKAAKARLECERVK